MPADAPTGDRQVTPPLEHSVVDLFFRSSGLPGVQWLSTLPKTRRWTSNWIRLTLILLPEIASFHVEEESFRIYPVSYTREPYLFPI